MEQGPRFPDPFNDARPNKRCHFNREQRAQSEAIYRAPHDTLDNWQIGAVIQIVSDLAEFSQTTINIELVDVLPDEAVAIEITVINGDEVSKSRVNISNHSYLTAALTNGDIAFYLRVADIDGVQVRVDVYDPPFTASELELDVEYLLLTGGDGYDEEMETADDINLLDDLYRSITNSYNQVLALASNISCKEDSPRPSFAAACKEVAEILERGLPTEVKENIDPMYFYVDPRAKAIVDMSEIVSQLAEDLPYCDPSEVPEVVTKRLLAPVAEENMNEMIEEWVEVNGYYQDIDGYYADDCLHDSNRRNMMTVHGGTVDGDVLRRQSMFIRAYMGTIKCLAQAIVNIAGSQVSFHDNPSDD